MSFQESDSVAIYTDRQGVVRSTDVFLDERGNCFVKAVDGNFYPISSLNGFERYEKKRQPAPEPEKPRGPKTLAEARALVTQRAAEALAARNRQRIAAQETVSLPPRVEALAEANRRARNELFRGRGGTRNVQLTGNEPTPEK